jgi:hypothetical protein
VLPIDCHLHRHQGGVVIAMLEMGICALRRLDILHQYSRGKMHKQWKVSKYEGLKCALVLSNDCIIMMLTVTS